MNENLQLKQNITYIEIKDESVIPELRERIQKGQSLTGLNIGKVINKSNLITDEGLNVIMRRLAGDTTYSLEINYGALGTGSTAVSASDTQLQTEVYRKLASSASYDGKTTYVDFFYEKADVDGTFTRFGNFIDGGAGANTGQLWSHIAVNWTKTDNEGLFVACRYTVSYKSS